jgi:hypothetical protein
MAVRGKNGVCGPRGFLILLLVVFLSGCVSHIQTLRDAQEEFNRAASLENAIKMDPKQGDVASLGNINASYRLSLTMLSGLINEKSADLEKDHLLGVAYTLKALTEWRLAEYPSALATISAVKEHPDNTLLPRDKAMVEALRGLIKNDQAYAHMVARDYSYEDIKTLLREALGDMDKGLAVPGAGENLRLYLLMAKLSTLKNWLDLKGDRSIPKPASFNEAAEKQDWCEHAKPAWSHFAGETGRIGTQEAASLQQGWSTKLGMPGACR